MITKRASKGANSLYFPFRQCEGFATAALSIMLATFVILPLGLLGFEFSRVFLLQSQLQAASDATALSGAAALASVPSQDAQGQLITIADCQIEAMDIAGATFMQQLMPGARLNSGNVTVKKNQPVEGAPQPGNHNAIIYLHLLDEKSNPVATGGVASQMSVDCFWTDRAMFGQSLVLPLPKEFTLHSYSKATCPKVDVVVCLDCSGSMDDSTPVSFVNCYWRPDANPPNSKVMYDVAPNGTGVLSKVTGCPVLGTGLNVDQPQNLSFATARGMGGNVHPFVFSEGPGPGGGVNLMRGLRAGIGGSGNMPEQGLPPGNYDQLHPEEPKGNGVDPLAYSNGFTDMVLTTPFSQDGFDFPNPATAVAASRGDLENPYVLLRSQCGSSNNIRSGLLPPARPGYYKAYWDAVHKQETPIGPLRSAATIFFQSMKRTGRNHGALICYTTEPGQDPSSVWIGGEATKNKVDKDYPGGGQGSFWCPSIPLDQKKDNFDSMIEAINGDGTTGATGKPLCALGETCFKDTINQAVAYLTGPGHRDGSDGTPPAQKAIVLFSDGLPNYQDGKQVDYSIALDGALAAADDAKTNRIPIYCLGLSQDPSSVLAQYQSQTMGDGRTSGQGVAYHSYNQGLYIPIASFDHLAGAFLVVQRILCKGVL